MSMKHYGIYLAYAPTVDMRDQGLGRHLAMFLKGAEELTDIRFTIVCPSWTKETLEALFESEQVSSEHCKIVSPDGKPYALRVFEAIKKYRARPVRKGWITRLAEYTAQKAEHFWSQLSARAVAVHDAATLVRFVSTVVALIVLLAPLLVLALPLVALVYTGYLVRRMSYRLKRIVRANFQWLFAKTSAVLASPHQHGWVLRLFEEMQKQEMRRMQANIAALTDVRAWYCPTAFWPSFHEIKAPRLMCVPDVVLTDFPVGFSAVGGDRFLSTFDEVGLSIRKGEHYVTYSDSVKWNTLVDRYAVSAANVTVIPHAPNTLNRYVEVTGFPDVEATSRHYCQTLLRGAFQRSTNPGYTSTFLNGDLKFLFYASQLRPNKNVLTLLRAYESLLRKRYLGHKLILTGYPADMPEIGRFVIDHRLENDVIFLHGLSVSELAACYCLADVAVNPTLSEGGCPFTFTEALSVNTPVVMARIPVTMEVLTDPYLDGVMFFDPYNWKDMAERIEWAVLNREVLLERQKLVYERLVQRTWQQVVGEHVAILDKISMAARETEVEP